MQDLAFLGELQTAITNKEFELWFQPKMSVKDNTVTSAECLVRWRHPSRGILLPSAFISLAENSGIIKSLTKLVIQQAAEGYKTLKDNGFDMSLSVNVSPASVVDPTIVSNIINSIVLSEMPADKLVLEVTEETFIHNTDDAARVLVSLESLGVRLSIDDFGTGYSSLMYLKNFPIHEIKLDRSFIIDLVQASAGFNIVKATINLAHDLNAVVVAEGVETIETLDMLTELECDYIQGCYIAKPMPLPEFISWLNETREK